MLPINAESEEVMYFEGEPFEGYLYTLAQDLVTSPRSSLKSPTRRSYIQIANKKWEIEDRTSADRKITSTVPKNTEISSIAVPIAKPSEPISKYEQQRNKNVQENKSYLR